MPNDTVSAAATGLPGITRRIFLRNTAAVGAVGATIAAPAVAEAAKPMTPHEQALWHIKELERLVTEDGGTQIVVIVTGTYGPKDHRIIGINYLGEPIDKHGMFRREGGAA